MEEKIKLFLSYASEDEDRVGALYDFLLNQSFKPWMDKKDILPGELWEPVIWKAIKQSDFFLICLSNNSVNKRGFLQKEIKLALNIWDEKLEEDIFLIPIRLEECNVPDNLSKFHWVNLYNEDGLSLLVKSIREGLNRQDKPFQLKESINIKVDEKVFKESREDNPRYEFEVSFPQFDSLYNPKLDEINNRIQGFVFEEIHNSRHRAYSSLKEDLNIHYEQLSIDFTITLLTRNVLSIIFNIYRYTSGSAHGGSEAVTFNYQLNPILPIHLSDIFFEKSDYLSYLSKYCIDDLKKQASMDDFSCDEMIEQGANPKVENFGSFNFKNNSLIITFDPYHVGSYAWGTRQVYIPYNFLKNIINQSSPVYSILNQIEGDPL